LWKLIIIWHWWNLTRIFHIDLLFKIIFDPKGLIHAMYAVYISLLCCKTILSRLSYVRTMLIERYPWWVSNLPLVDPTILSKSMNTLGTQQMFGQSCVIRHGRIYQKSYTAEVDCLLAYSFDTAIDTWSLTRYWPPFFNSSFIRTL